MKDGITAWLQRAVILLCCGLVLPITGCLFQEQLDALSEQVGKLRESLEFERLERKRLKEATDMALVSATCQQDVLELLKQVLSACETSAEFCELTKIPLAIIDADPTHEGRFLTMMATQRHAAIYSLKGIDDPWGNTFNQQRFATLMSQRRLASTKILIVANVDSSKKTDKRQASAENRTRLKEAKSRLNVVAQRLRGLGIADNSMVTMVFPFTLKKTEHLNVDDKQPPGALEITSSVWIFLTNCFPEKR